MGILNFFKAKPYHIDVTSQGSIDGVSNKTILQSADEQGVDLPHSCRVGGCGACKCKLKQGKVKALTEAAYVLTEKELEEGYILTCQSQPKSDLTLEFPEMKSSAVTPGYIKQIKALTSDVFKVSISTDKPLDFIAGQYVEITVRDFPYPRCYSIVNAPMQVNQELHFFIQQVKDGSVSNWLTNTSHIGNEIQLSNAKGGCTSKSALQNGSLIFAATGSGLAPIVSLLNQQLAEQSNRSVELLIGANNESDLFYLDELRSIQSRWESDFNIHTIFSKSNSINHSPIGYIQDHLEKLINHIELHNADLFVCGNPNMVENVASKCQSLGMKPDQIHMDKFVNQKSNSIQKQLA